jgi:peptidoglycan/LPS O-acetylase OafA/YrhL
MSTTPSNGAATVSPGGSRLRGEIRALTGLRALAAGWVVVHHAWALSATDNWVSLLEPLRPLFQTGWLGVDLFFVLSGFVLTHTYLQKMGHRARLGASASFLWKRFSRVWPTWAVVTLLMTGWLVLKHLTVGGEHLHEGVQPEVGPLSLIEQLLMVQVWNQPLPWGSGVIGPGWSLSAEWLAYCTFPIVVLGLFRLRRLPAFILGLGAVAAVVPFVAVVAAEGYHDWEWSWLLRISGGFLAGALTSMCVARIRDTAAVQKWAAVVAGGSLVAVATILWWADLNLAYGDYAGIAVLVFPVLIGSLALTDGGPARLFSKQWMVMGGRISFALYLVHECLFEVFWTATDHLPLLGPDSRWQALAAPIVLVATVPVAWLLWRFVEEPARRRLGSLAVGDRRAAAPVVPAPRMAEPAVPVSTGVLVPGALPPVRRPTPDLSPAVRSAEQRRESALIPS